MGWELKPYVVEDLYREECVVEATFLPQTRFLLLTLYL
jgi:hypothetical protein